MACFIDIHGRNALSWLEMEEEGIGVGEGGDWGG